MKTEIVDTSPNNIPIYEPGLIVCTCHSSDHCIIYNKWEDCNFVKNSDDEDCEVRYKSVFMEVSLEVDKSIWIRVKRALRYIFKNERYGTHGEIIIDKTNVSGLEDIVNFIKE